MILGPIGIVIADAMLGEITPAMAGRCGAECGEAPADSGKPMRQHHCRCSGAAYNEMDSKRRRRAAYSYDLRSGRKPDGSAEAVRVQRGRTCSHTIDIKQNGYQEGICPRQRTDAFFF